MNLREWALPLYTILLQLATGALLVLWAIRAVRLRRVPATEVDRIIRNPILVIAFTAAMGMLSAHLHLSRPLLSWLAVTNFRTSWLSREIIFTVLFFIAVSGLWLLSQQTPPRRKWMSAVGWLGSALGLTGVFCMANIYLLPSQAAWNSPTTIYSFYVTVVLLGVMTIACLLILDLRFAALQAPGELHVHNDAVQSTLPALALVGGLAVLADLALIFYEMYYLERGNLGARTSLQLLLSLYLPLLVMRVALLIAAPIWMGYTASLVHKRSLEPGQAAIPVYFSCLAVLVAEIIGRFLFYATHIRIGL
jgi:anaerobic dimethyl sulfoxide reductase subunit C (anchor subunit)